MALTRAKKMLILVGHIHSLKSYSPLQSVINILKEKDSVSFNCAGVGFVLQLILFWFSQVSFTN